MILRNHFHFFMMVLSGGFSEKTPVKDAKFLSENVPKKSDTAKKQANLTGKY